MGETRVNLKHLLEDLRDTYPCPPEEAIITELIANSLDSGASLICFWTRPEERMLTVIDNGTGMNRADLENYHDIAATTKARGKGIGFAGLGVKLSLLFAEVVVTETRCGTFHGATSWRLDGPQRAPWDFVLPPGAITAGNGTAVSIVLRTPTSLLLDPRFVQRVIQRHFYPLLDPAFGRILNAVYKSGVAFLVNATRVRLPDSVVAGVAKVFLVTIGRKSKPVGIGFVRKATTELPEEDRGVAVSTFGKVIKRGWDWVGLSPRRPTFIAGVVEIPQLSEILATNKADFLKDTASLPKYYRYRKAIQEAIEPILREMGELTPQRERPEKDLRPLEREIEQALGKMLEDFPELSSLLGRRRRAEAIEGVLPDTEAEPAGTTVNGVETMTGTKGGGSIGSGMDAAPGDLPGERLEPNEAGLEPGLPHVGHKRRPGLMIGFEDDPSRQDLGWLVESTIWVNRGHPAFQRAAGADAEDYHVVLTVAWVLSSYIEAEKSPQTFVSTFLATWATGH